jgi:hypothetical protein
MPLKLYPRRGNRGISDVLLKYLDLRNAAYVTGGKPIAVRSQSISDVSAVNPLVAFYDIHGRKGEVLFFCSVLDTRLCIICIILLCIIIISLLLSPLLEYRLSLWIKHKEK